MTLPSGHPVTAWLVEHVADVLTKHLVGSDGHTAYERLFGKQAREEGLEFGEQVLYRKRRAQDMNVVLDGRLEPGTWLGRRWGVDRAPGACPRQGHRGPRCAAATRAREVGGGGVGCCPCDAVVDGPGPRSGRSRARCPAATPAARG